MADCTATGPLAGSLCGICPDCGRLIYRRAGQAILSDLGAATPPGTARAYQDATKVIHLLALRLRLCPGGARASD
jgi:hypothetical protein